MKKIVDGLEYDTSKAKKIWSKYESNFMGFYRDYKLYLTKHERFFMVKINCGLFSFDKDLVPYTYEELYKWMMKYYPEEISKVFKIEEA